MTWPSAMSKPLVNEGDLDEGPSPVPKTTACHQVEQRKAGVFEQPLCRELRELFRFPRLLEQRFEGGADVLSLHARETRPEAGKRGRKVGMMRCCEGTFQEFWLEKWVPSLDESWRAPLWAQFEAMFPHFCEQEPCKGCGTPMLVCFRHPTLPCCPDCSCESKWCSPWRPLGPGPLSPK